MLLKKTLPVQGISRLGLLAGDSTDILQSVDRSSQAGLGLIRGCAVARQCYVMLEKGIVKMVMCPVW